jgi:hypothetical protein
MDQEKSEQAYTKAYNKALLKGCLTRAQQNFTIEEQSSIGYDQNSFEWGLLCTYPTCEDIAELCQEVVKEIDGS